MILWMAPFGGAKPTNYCKIMEQEAGQRNCSHTINSGTQKVCFPQGLSCDSTQFLVELGGMTVQKLIQQEKLGSTQTWKHLSRNPLAMLFIIQWWEYTYLGKNVWSIPVQWCCRTFWVFWEASHRYTALAPRWLATQLSHPSTSRLCLCWAFWKGTQFLCWGGSCRLFPAFFLD